MSVDWSRYLAILPGLTGDIARWVDSTLRFSQPGISIPISLAFVAALKSKCYEPLLGAHVPIFTCAIAPSGTGKTQAQHAIKSLIRECRLNTLIMGEPASDSAILKVLTIESRRLLIWDEFGLALSELIKSMSTHRALILDLLMKIFSNAGFYFEGKEYADPTRERADIPEPYLSIFAASTSTTFFDAIDSTLLTRGFLPRWLVFFSEVNRVEQKPVPVNLVPATIVDRVMRYERWSKPESGGNLKQVLGRARVKLKFDESSFEGEKKLFLESVDSDSETRRVIWSRGVEQVLKICTIFAEGNEVSFPDMMIAFNLVRDVGFETIARCESGLSDSSSKFDKDKIKAREKFLAFLKTFKIGERVSLDVLRRNSHNYLNASERNSILSELISAGMIEAKREHLDRTSRSRGQVYYFLGDC